MVFLSKLFASFPNSTYASVSMSKQKCVHASSIRGTYMKEMSVKRGPMHVINGPRSIYFNPVSPYNNDLTP